MMYTLRQFLSFAAVGALVLSVASIDTRAEELAQNLGPVGAHEPILTTVGGKRVIAFYGRVAAIAISTSSCGIRTMPVAIQRLAFASA